MLLIRNKVARSVRLYIRIGSTLTFLYVNKKVVFVVISINSGDYVFENKMFGSLLHMSVGYYKLWILRLISSDAFFFLRTYAEYASMNEFVCSERHSVYVFT